LERSGAATDIVNATPPAAGAIATVVWTRAAFEQGRRRPQEGLEGYAVAAAK
jgi:hypothetical protein